MQKMMNGKALQNDALLYPEDLASIEGVLYEAPESELQARRFLQMKTDDPPWVEYVGFDRLTKSKEAKILARTATNFPLVDADVSRVMQKVFGIYSGFRVLDDDLTASRALGKAIDTTKAAIARRAVSEEEDSIAINGEPGFGIPGLLTVEGHTEHAASEKNAAGNTYWDACTMTEGAVIIAHLRQARQYIQSLPGYNARVLVLPSDLEEYLTYWVDSQKTTTVTDFITKAGWFPAGIFYTDALPVTKLVVLDNSPDHIRLSVPEDIRNLNTWRDSPISSLIPVRERTAGVIAYYPLSIAVVTGVHS